MRTTDLVGQEMSWRFVGFFSQSFNILNSMCWRPSLVQIQITNKLNYCSLPTAIHFVRSVYFICTCRKYSHWDEHSNNISKFTYQQANDQCTKKSGMEKSCPVVSQTLRPRTNYLIFYFSSLNRTLFIHYSNI